MERNTNRSGTKEMSSELERPPNRCEFLEKSGPGCRKQKICLFVQPTVFYIDVIVALQNMDKPMVCFH